MRNINLLIAKSCIIFLILASCSDKTTTFKKENTVYISGQLKNYNDSTGLITYDEYGLLNKTSKEDFDVDSVGNFNFSIEVDKPIKGTLHFGRVMIDDIGNNRYVHVFLNPGDSVHVEANMDVLSDELAIKNSLKLTGSGAVNSMFVNQEDFEFNSYQQRRENNYLFIVEKQGSAYLKTIDSILDLKLNYINDYNKKYPLSEKLVEISKDEYINLAIIRKFNYPSSHKGYTKGKTPVLPNNYYDFVKDVKISENLDEKGLPYLRFLHFYITNKQELEKTAGNNQDFLDFVNQELKDKSKYIYLAYSLGTDFKAEVYNQFGDNCPFDDVKQIVADKYGHLEKMLPGKPSPVLDLLDIDDQVIASADVFTGSYTFIDLWATWCKPCIEEFPSIDKLKKQYKNENIQFVSISMDKDKDAWINYVKKHNLEGTQLWVDSVNKDIIDEGYNITMIPRFVFLDPAGKIISANAPRPSSDVEIRTLFNSKLKTEI